MAAKDIAEAYNKAKAAADQLQEQYERSQANNMELEVNKRVSLNHHMHLNHNHHTTKAMKKIETKTTPTNKNRESNHHCTVSFRMTKRKKTITMRTTPTRQIMSKTVSWVRPGKAPAYGRAKC